MIEGFADRVCQDFHDYKDSGFELEYEPICYWWEYYGPNNRPDIASTIDAISFFGAIVSIIDQFVVKQKATNYLLIFALPK